MNSGIYKACTGLLRQVSRLEAITENLANCNTPGYRRVDTKSKTFLSRFHDAMNRRTTEDGVHLNRMLVDFTAGPMQQTDRALDFAIAGNAFFVVEQDGKPYYTRNGAFEIDVDGYLVNSAGMRVKGDVELPPDLDPARLHVGPDGSLMYQGKSLGTLEMVSFQDPQRLIRVGHTLFEPPSDMAPESPPEGTAMHNRMLEGSNTSIYEEMTDLIVCMRNFEACQKILSAQDSAQGQMITGYLQ
ncbi:MAG: flagellar hook basal-body protein [Kiritimatiellae bacterium]|nr:flagellar hook basal-body protein [Kiritimatiellia bacterium]